MILNDHAPCKKCGKLIISKFPLCKACRSIPCAKCKLPFTPMSQTATVCSYCKSGSKRKVKP